jgi:hypothetical protein
VSRCSKQDRSRGKNADIAASSYLGVRFRTDPTKTKTLRKTTKWQGVADPQTNSPKEPSRGEFENGSGRSGTENDTRREVACCEGGPTQPKCRLCPDSPTLLATARREHEQERRSPRSMASGFKKSLWTGRRPPRGFTQHFAENGLFCPQSEGMAPGAENRERAIRLDWRNCWRYDCACLTGRHWARRNDRPDSSTFAISGY